MFGLELLTAGLGISGFIPLIAGAAAAAPYLAGTVGALGIGGAAAYDWWKGRGQTNHTNTGGGKPQNKSPQNQGSNTPQQQGNDTSTQNIYNDPWYTTGTGGGYGGGGGVNYAQQNANQIAQLEQSKNVINQGLGRLDGQLGIALDNIDTQKRIKDNEAQTQFNSTQGKYKTSTTQNQQSFRGNKNTIQDQASSGLRGLSRLLGSYGAVGSDLGLAGQAVANVASQQNAGAGETFAKNQNSLDTNWGNYKNEWEQERKKRNDWQAQEHNKSRQQSASTRQDLLSRLADIEGQIGAARGGSYAQSAQSYLDQANALSGQIDALGRINPTYTGVTPQYQQASLDSYQTERAQTGVSPSEMTGGLNTPWLNQLLGRDKEKQALGY